MVIMGNLYSLYISQHFFLYHYKSTWSTNKVVVVVVKLNKLSTSHKLLPSITMFSTTYPQVLNFFQLWVRKSGGGGIWGASCAAGTIQMWISYLSQLWSSHETNRNPIGSFSNDDSEGSENAKTEIGLLSKTTSLHVHHAFLYISLPLLCDYDVKMPKFTFSWGCKQATFKFSSSF